MTIGYLINNLRSGGAEKFVKELSKEVSKHHNVVVILLNDKSTAYTIDESDTLKSATLTGKSLLSKHFSLRKVLIKYDVNILHVNLFPSSYIAAFLPRHIILIYTEHSMWNKRRRLFYKPLERLIFSRYTEIVCVSNSAKESLLRHIGNSFISKVSVIYNGINLDRVKPNYADKHGKWHIILIGRLEAPKDQLTVLKSLLPIKEKVHIDVFGVGAMLSVLKELAVKNNLDISFHGFVEDIDSVKFNERSIGILSSNKEGFGLSLLDTMSRDIVTLGSNIGGIREVLDNNDLLFPVADVSRLTTLILNLIDNPQDYTRMRDYCKNRAIKFSFRNTVVNYLSIYHKYTSKC